MLYVFRTGDTIKDGVAAGSRVIGDGAIVDEELRYCVLLLLLLLR